MKQLHYTRGIDLGDLQDAVEKWHRKNFPDATPQDIFMVLTEELGELAHSWIKRKQGIRMNEDHDTKLHDAVGDIVIALMAFCAIEGIPADRCVQTAWSEVRERDWTMPVIPAEEG